VDCPISLRYLGSLGDGIRYYVEIHWGIPQLLSSFSADNRREEECMLRNEKLRALKAAWLAALMAIVLVRGARAQAKYEPLYRFIAGADGSMPSSDLIFDSTGSLYGTTRGGGASGSGTVFKLTPNADGGWTESVLYSFCSLTKCADGEEPGAGMIFDEAGNLYGTTDIGGVASCSEGCGVVFELTPHQGGNWTESVLYSFCSLTNCADGMSSSGSLIFDQLGNLYGTAGAGGRTSCNEGCGVVFELMPISNGKWKEKVLHGFNGDDGAYPDAGLIFDAAGNLYGTTGVGGAESTCNAPLGCGVVFELTPKAGGNWKEKVLHRFVGGDGNDPTARLIFDSAGNLYSTTAEGGALSQCGGIGCGVVFELTPNAGGSWKEKTLHRFGYGTDGSTPYSDLIFDQAGNLYGTTSGGGAGLGVVFKLAPNSTGGWNGKVLHKFTHNGSPDGGARPYAGLIFDATGNLYGTTILGGNSNDCGKSGCGVVFKLTVPSFESSTKLWVLK
jgi:uncharacterized repeat protein (TIGR03803 family)